MLVISVARGDEVVAQGNACEAKVLVEVWKVVLEDERNAVGHDLLNDRQVMPGRAWAEDLVRSFSLDLPKRLSPGLQRGRIGVHQPPGLDLAVRIADQLPEMNLLGHVLKQVAVFRFALSQGLRGRLALDGEQGLRLRRGGAGAGGQASVLQAINAPAQQEDHYAQPIGWIRQGELACRLNPEVIGQYRRQGRRQQARTRPP